MLLWIGCGCRLDVWGLNYWVQNFDRLCYFKGLHRHLESFT